jgi:hypothetical protein
LPAKDEVDIREDEEDYSTGEYKVDWREVEY